MTDEEKKAIKKVKYICDKWYDENLEIEVKWLESLLSLCEKQQKEIKEAEQKEKKAYIDGTNVAHELCNKMWKNKIKAKIEELEKLNDEATGTGYGFAIYYLQSFLQKE